MTGLPVGSMIPSFDLIDENGEVFNSYMMKGLRWVLFIFPRAGTPGCTQEAREFNDLHATFMTMNIPVIGLSTDPPKKLSAFRDKNSFRLKFLSDESHGRLDALGAWGLKKSYGKEYEGIIRTTMIIGPGGSVEAVWDNVKVKDHARTVLDMARSLTRRA